MWQKDQEYKKANYDQFIFRAKKGKKEEYRQASEDLGLGLMEMFRQAVEEFIANHADRDLPVKPPPLKSKPVESITQEQKRLVEEFSRLPIDAQKAFIKAFKAINDTKGGD